MSSIYSSMRRKNRDWLIGTFAAAACLRAAMAFASCSPPKRNLRFSGTRASRYFQ